MRRLALVVLLAGVLLAALAVGVTRHHERPAVAHPHPAASPTADPDSRFLTVVSPLLDLPADHSADASTISLAHTICGAFTGGMTFPDVLALMVAKSVFTATQDKVQIIAAVGAYCPEHAALIPDGTI